VAAFLDYVDQSWGTGGTVINFAPSRANDPAYQRWWGRMERLGASPAAAKTLLRMNRQIGISDIVPTIRVPTLVIHRTGDLVVNVEADVFWPSTLSEHAISSFREPTTNGSWATTLKRLPMLLRSFLPGHERR
jgi:hypothetical protein